MHSTLLYICICDAHPGPRQTRSLTDKNVAKLLMLATSAVAATAAATPMRTSVWSGTGRLVGLLLESDVMSAAVLLQVPAMSCSAAEGMDAAGAAAATTATATAAAFARGAAAAADALVEAGAADDATGAAGADGATGGISAAAGAERTVAATASGLLPCPAPLPFLALRGDEVAMPAAATAALAADTLAAAVAAATAAADTAAVAAAVASTVAAAATAAVAVSAASAKAAEVSREVGEGTGSAGSTDSIAVSNGCRHRTEGTCQEWHIQTQDWPAGWSGCQGSGCNCVDGESQA